MKAHKILLLAVIVVHVMLFSTELFAAYDHLIPQRQRGKFFTPSIRTRLEYNDNVSAKRGSGGGRGPAHQRIKSTVWYTEPKVAFRIPLDTTYIGVDYKYSLAYFWARPYDNEDVAHDLTARFKHSFTPRLSLDLDNSYTRQQVGVIKRARDTGNGYHVIRENGDFELNNLDVAVKYDFTRSFYTTFKYGLEFLDFDTYDESRTFDYLENRIGFESGYIVNKDTILLGGYTFKDRSYRLRENADYDSHLLFGGVNYRLGKFFSLDSIAGVDFRKYEAPTRTNRGIDFDAVPLAPFGETLASSVTTTIKQGDTKLHKNPYVRVRLSSNYFRNMVVTLGYLLMVQSTEQEDFTDSNSQSGSLQISWRFMPKISLDLNMIYSIDNYDGRVYQTLTTQPGYIAKRVAYDNPETKAFRMGAVFSYQVTPWLFYELGYRRTDFDSDFNTSTWERNQVFTGVNAVF
ncbi:MAG: hypothetical protein RBU23_07150 [Candidatus Auribacterota bacterium]|jgi:hypothetical protein|nr:hypothetical protein [Candidatus Auribacterota bacterium]